MWEVTSSVAAPVYMVGVLTGAALCAAVVLVMSLSADDMNALGPSYETRRSINLLEAARHQAQKLHDLDTVKPPALTGVVSLSSEWETQCWSDRFSATPRALSHAIKQVGPMAADIGRYLGTSPTPHTVPQTLRIHAPAPPDLLSDDQRGAWVERAVPVAIGVSGSCAINALILVSAFS